jgi:hypothetical protein
VKLKVEGKLRSPHFRFPHLGLDPKPIIPTTFGSSAFRRNEDRIKKTASALTTDAVLVICILPSWKYLLLLCDHLHALADKLQTWGSEPCS